MSITRRSSLLSWSPLHPPLAPYAAGPQQGAGTSAEATRAPADDALDRREEAPLTSPQRG